MRRLRSAEPLGAGSAVTLRAARDVYDQTRLPENDAMEWNVRRFCLSVAIGASCSMAGCKPAEAPPAPPASGQAVQNAEPRQDLPDEQRSPDLFGAWVVESVGTPAPAPKDRSWDMILLVGARQLEVLSQCVTIGPFDYGRTGGGGIAVRQVAIPAGPQPGTMPPRVQCARALSPAEAAVSSILPSVVDVERKSGGAVSLTGRAGSITLRRPQGALSNPRGQMPPPRAPLLLGAWRFVSVDGRTLAANEGMELLLRPWHLEWRSGCVNEIKELRREGDNLVPGAADPFPVCERGRSKAELSAERLFTGTVATRMGQDARLRLEGSGIVAELVPLTS